jgi:hypothetical protein
MAPVRRIVTELGEERRCSGCGEFWPIDGEFWYFDPRGQVLGRCKACWSERPRIDGRRTFTPLHG